MDGEKPEEARARRLEAIRARRGTPERAAAIQAQENAKRQELRKAQQNRSGRKTPDNSRDMFGHPWPFWFQMRDAGYRHLVSCARARQMTSYGDTWRYITEELGEETGNQWRQLPQLLGYIGDHSFDEMRLIITALVLYAEAKEPASRAGVLPAGGIPRAPGRVRGSCSG